MSPAATPTSTPTSSPGSAAAQQAEELGSSPSVATPAELSSTRSKNSIDEAWLAGARKRRKAFGAGAGEAEKMLTDLMVDSLHSSAATEAKGSGKRSSAVIARGFMSFILLAGLVVRHPSFRPGCVSFDCTRLKAFRLLLPGAGAGCVRVDGLEGRGEASRVHRVQRPNVR